MGKIITAATYNLHGTQENDSERFYQIAKLLWESGVIVCGFQEVINGAGIEDTSWQLAKILMAETNSKWYTYWQYCHHFYDLYPEGISILSAYPIEEIFVSDLSKNRGRIAPLMQRYALIATINVEGLRVRFAVTHLDHHKLTSVRTYQTRQIISDFFVNCAQPCELSFITGDMNATEKSACLKVFKKNGFLDTYRKTNKTGGDTFPASSPYTRIDYIFAKGGKIAESYLLPSDPGTSDHIGIVTKIEI